MGGHQVQLTFLYTLSTTCEGWKSMW